MQIIVTTIFCHDFHLMNKTKQINANNKELLLTEINS